MNEIICDVLGGLVGLLLVAVSMVYYLLTTDPKESASLLLRNIE